MEAVVLVLVGTAIAAGAEVWRRAVLGRRLEHALEAMRPIVATTVASDGDNQPAAIAARARDAGRRDRALPAPAGGDPSPLRQAS